MVFKFALPIVAAIFVVSSSPRLFAGDADASGPSQDKQALPYACVLGVAQDGGYPQAGCNRQCCKPAWDDVRQRRFVSCLAIIDPRVGKFWLLDCTPDFRDQLRLVSEEAGRLAAEGTEPQEPIDLELSGIFLTHAHIGHYTGLMHLGREVMGTRDVDVFAMPRMRYFLESNGPWSQLVKLNQVRLQHITAGSRFAIGEDLFITPFLVPHRDEFSETVGFLVERGTRSLLYIPDIDKWDRWSEEINQKIASVDFAFVDGTFFSSDELPGRDMSEIPHPSIEESMEHFSNLTDEQKGRVHFIHLNHSNPLLHRSGDAYRRVRSAGFHVAEQGSRFPL